MSSSSREDVTRILRAAKAGDTGAASELLPAAIKRGGERHRIDVEGAGVSLAEIAVASDVPAEDMLPLDEALDELEREDSRTHRIVMLRFPQDRRGHDG